MKEAIKIEKKSEVQKTLRTGNQTLDKSQKRKFVLFCQDREKIEQETNNRETKEKFQPRNIKCQFCEKLGTALDCFLYKKRELQCDHCKKIGHKSVDCYSLKEPCQLCKKRGGQQRSVIPHRKLAIVKIHLMKKGEQEPH